jgi:P27 family predicted phage terminase small subunit
MAGTNRSGRKPKPTKLKVVQGNAGKRKLNDKEPEAESLNDVPKAPDWMPEHAKGIWDRAAAWLVGAKILTKQDLHNLESFAMAYARWRQAQDHVTEHGITVENPSSGALQKNPALTVINEANRQMVVFGSALGLDPASRARLATQGGDEENPFADLLGPKKGSK